MFDFNTILDNIQDNIDQSSLKITFDYIFRSCLVNIDLNKGKVSSCPTYPLDDYEHHIYWEDEYNVYFYNLVMNPKDNISLDILYRYKFVFDKNYKSVSIIYNKSIYDNIQYIIDEQIYRFINNSPIPIKSYKINSLKSFTSGAPIIFPNNYIIPYNIYESNRTFYFNVAPLNENNVLSFLTYCNTHKFTQTFINNFPTELSHIGQGFNYKAKGSTNYFLIRNMFDNDEDFLKILNVYTKYGYSITDEYFNIYDRYVEYDSFPFDVEKKNEELKLKYQDILHDNVIYFTDNTLEHLNSILKVYNTLKEINSSYIEKNLFNNKTIVKISKENSFNYTYLKNIFKKYYEGFIRVYYIDFNDFLYSLILMLVQQQIIVNKLIPIRYYTNYEKFAIGTAYNIKYRTVYNKLSFNNAFDIYLKHPNDLCQIFNYVKNAMIYLNDDNIMKMILTTLFLGFSPPTYKELFKDIHNYIIAHNIPDYDKSLFNNTILNSTVNNMIEWAYKKAIKNKLLQK
jgi:hypothetical protein